MQNLHVAVKNRVATYSNRDGVIICDNSNYKIIFTFDAEWSAHAAKTARFIWNGSYKDVEFTGTECTVPEIADAILVEVGVYVDEFATTTGAKIPCTRSIKSGNPTAQPADIKKWRDEAEESADRAETAAEALADALDEMTETLGDLGAALDVILNIQEELIGGEG